MRTRFFVVLLAVVTLVGAFPPARAQAFAPPLPVAPPVTGLCTAPVGLIICGTAAAGYMVVDWFDVPGMWGAAPGGNGEWCLTETGHMFPEGSSSCNPVTVDPSPDLLGQVRNQFEPKPGMSFDPQGSYMWVPADPEAACHSTETDLCVEFALTQYNAGAVEVYAQYTITSENMCPKSEGLFATGLGFIRIPSGGAGTGNFDECWWLTPQFGSDTISCPGHTRGCLVAYDETLSDGPYSMEGLIGGSGGFHYTRAWDRDNTGPVEMQPRSGDDASGRFLIGWMEDGSMKSVSAGPTEVVTMERLEEEFEGIYQTRFECRNADGDVMEVTQSLDAVIVSHSAQLPTATCPAGWVPVGGVVEICDALNPEVCIEVGRWDPPPGVDLSDPEELVCIIKAGAGNPCKMWLEEWNGSEWDICMTGVNCEGWWQHASRQTLYRCGWGGSVRGPDTVYLDASQCIALKDWFEETPAMTPVVPGQPQPDPVDPTTIITGPPTPTTARPTGTWLTTIITEWATGGSPSLQDSCWPQGWGLLNPLQWVMRPVMCALTFLFVPTTPVQTQLDELWMEARSTTRLGTVLEAGELITDIPSLAVGSSCGWGIPPVETGTFTTPEVQLIMCPSDFNMAGTASTVRSWGFAVLGVWVIGMLFRWLELGRPEDAPDEGTDGGMV